MDYKEQLKKLIEIVKEHSRLTGKKLSRDEIAARLGFGGTYLSRLIGPTGEVNETHILLFKNKFSEELAAAGIPLAGDPLNEERAMLLALQQDYLELAARLEGLPVRVVEERLKGKATLILKGLNARR
ncbi:hypothetical protein [Chitinophaga sp. sic0106]|uniref:hypothetical protein n=1 Tax=Chitinophaga sp. sic0106 TaxID=2854785 RepID=UPI001C4460F4|nr:hypothetical protein [Chitinophaga sp. sic0106]MBV7531329.1 hypothetical protein [Chitinophaga sp. sic0106]